MADQTTFLGLNKPNPITSPNENFNVDTFVGGNMDKIDQELAKYHRTFSSADWTVNNSATDGYPASITIAVGTHKLAPKSGFVRCYARSLVSGVYMPGTWAAFETFVVYDTTTHNITIKATSAYAGDILIYS